MKLSIIIPVFNEEKTITEILQKINALLLTGVEKEIIVVDDGSTDATASVISNFQMPRLSSKRAPSSAPISNFKIIKHKKNQGKGAAVRTGIKNATGDYILIQDADLEYNPADIDKLLAPVIKGQVWVVYGSRLRRLPNFSRDERTLQFFIHYLGNKFLSLLTSILYGQWITDMETGYKLFPKRALAGIILHAKGFDFEPEVTVKLLKRKIRIFEVPITTNPRGYNEGKKLNTIRDGIIAFWTLVKYKFIN